MEKKMCENLRNKPKSYEDVLSRQRFFGSDIWSAFKKWPLPQNLETHLSPTQIKNEVLFCDSVQQTIQNVSEESKRKREDVEKEALAIIDRMAHDFCSRSFRSLLYLVLKILKKLFTSINIDTSGFQKLKELVKDRNIILLPNHRSYVDFLLISTVLFLQEIPIPVIAATEDFLNMVVVGSALRESGAFFIRRSKSIMTDKLYRTILTKFVHVVTINGHHPLKFYVEGTRSRTGKSLYPKIGLLQMTSDLYFRRCVPDLTIIPISISYDRVLEERLYAHELLGIPKPKESTLKLLESMSVFQESYGSVYLSVGDQISVHEFMKKSNTFSNTVIPRNLKLFSSDNLQSIRDLSLMVIKSHLKNLIIPPFCATAILLLNYIQHCQFTINAFDLKENLAWLLKFVHHYRGTTFYEDNGKSSFSLETIMKHHQNIVRMNKGNVIVCHHESGSMKDEDKACNPVPILMITYYANHLLQLIICPCLVVVALAAYAPNYVTRQVLKEDVLELSKLVQRDFIFVPNMFDSEFDSSLDALIHENFICRMKDQVIINSVKKVRYLQSMVVPLIFIRKIILDSCKSVIPVDEAISLCRQSASKLKMAGFDDCRILCKDTTMNAIQSLIDCKFLTFVTNDKNGITAAKDAELISSKLDCILSNIDKHFKDLKSQEIPLVSHLHSKL